MSHKTLSTMYILLMSLLFTFNTCYAESSQPTKNKYWEAYFKSKLRDPPAGFIVEGLETIKQSHPDKIAVDFGCGVGHETAELLKNGYRVVAIDSQPEAFEYMKQLPEVASQQHKVKTIVSTFEKLNFAEIPQADLLIASFSLPFMKSADFNRVWPQVVSKIKPGGYFIGNFFAPDFSFFAAKFRHSMTFHNKPEAIALLNSFEIVDFKEVNVPGTKPGTMNHYFVFVGKKR